MFSKKSCPRCGKKTSKKNSYCPACGLPLNKNQKKQKEDFGMLGQDDVMDFSQNSLFGGMGANFMNKMLSSTMKMLEKELQKEMQRNSGIDSNQAKNIQNPNMPKTKIRLMINGKEVDLGGNGIKPNKVKEEKPKAKLNSFSEEQAKKFSKLPKKEPKTNLKRIGDKITYEIEIPEVKSIEEISITPLENSIEIKAIGKEKAYSKSIPLNLPIAQYTLSDGLLILEFQGE